MSYRFFLFIAALLIAQTTTAQLFSDLQIISGITAPRSVHSVDLDGDGDMDVLFAAGGVTDKIAWYENLGGGIFGPQQIISTVQSNPRSVHAADLDGDGDMDVLVASYQSPNLTWYENLGEGFFGDVQVIPAFLDNASVYTADIDGDGDLDVLASSTETTGVDKIVWYENLGGGLFGAQQTISTAVDYPQSVYSADLDGDGDMDVLSASSEDDKIAWYVNQGGGIFGLQQIISTQANGAKSVRTADLDGDGDMDVLSASGYDDKIAWYENLGGGIFGPQQIISSQVEWAHSVDVADLDNDGDMDVLSASYSALSLSADEDKIAWYENLGGGLFGPEQIISTQADGVNSIYTADLDGDGDIDVLSSNGLLNNITWFENLMTGCTDPSACNYNPNAVIESNNCCYECGCTVIGAENYDPLACHDDGSCRFPVFGVVFFDENENGLMDGDENGLAFQEVGLLPNGISLTTNENGNFLVTAIGSDEYTFALAENPQFPFFTTPQTLTFDATQENWNQDTLFFGVSNEFPAFDLEANLYSVIAGFPCNNFRAYYLCFRNTSNNPVDVQLEFHYDSLFQDITLSPLIDSLGAYVAYLSYTGVAPYELVCTQLQLLSPTVAFIGEFLETSLEVHAFYEGAEVAFGADSLSQELLCAYDPNDKQVFPEGYSEAHYIANDTILEYLIRFQNTGNAPAIDVIVRDTLDQNLDLSTFQLVVNSHSVFTTVDPTTRELEFYFQDIMLPDSVSNEPESHGLISFKIRPEAGLPLLTELNNTAAIYFDNNPPIITNTTWSTIYDCSLFTVNFTEEGAILTASEGDHYQWFLNGEALEGENEQEHLAFVSGNYSVQVDIDFPCSGISGSSFIVVTSIQELDGKEIKLFPNPMTTSAMIDLGELRGSIQLEIYDVMGKLQRSELLNVDSGMLMLNRGSLSNGTYILRLTHEKEAMELKFVVE
jgi:uncharacterized repeat protein (TIGR01451 family)